MPGRETDWVAALYDAHGASMYSYALALPGVSEEAEDAVQDVFVKVCASDRMPDNPRRFDRGIAMAHCAQTAMALKQYKAKQGEYPEGLEVLSPEYMKKVPVDPFTGSPLHYRREGDGFVLYSVSQDRQDDGGKPQTGFQGDVVWCAVN